MSAERKDLRLKLDPDTHAGISLLADVAGLDLAEWAESVLVREVRRQVHDASVIASRAARLGISGSAGE